MGVKRDTTWNNWKTILHLGVLPNPIFSGVAAICDTSSMGFHLCFQWPKYFWDCNLLRLRKANSILGFPLIKLLIFVGKMRLWYLKTESGFVLSKNNQTYLVAGKKRERVRYLLHLNKVTLISTPKRSKQFLINTKFHCNAQNDVVTMVRKEKGGCVPPLTIKLYNTMFGWLTAYLKYFMSHRLGWNFWAASNTSLQY